MRTTIEDVRHLCPITAAAHDAGSAFHAEVLVYYRTTLERVEGCTHDTAAIVAGVMVYVTRRRRRFVLRETHASVVDAEREIEAAAALINGEAREIGQLRGAHADLVRSMRRARDVLRATARRWREWLDEDRIARNDDAIRRGLLTRTASKPE
ncbi:MAG TPA: hypothetical protein PLZ50_10620 [Rubrivivax sp.]|nr:hypothetical protein [Rubrivivax sp.]